MKRIPVLLALALCTAATMRAEDRWAFKGTVIKMQMIDCVVSGFKASMSGVSGSPARCPEYTVIGPNVVYVMVGRNSEAFMPLAENLNFEVRKQEIVLSDKTSSKFAIQQMTLRSDWEREEARKELEAEALERSVTYELRHPPRSSFTASK